jgi:hypothetical protein
MNETFCSEEYLNFLIWLVFWNYRFLLILADINSYTKTQNGVAILCFEIPFWVWFLIHESVTTLSWIVIIAILNRGVRRFTQRLPVEVDSNCGSFDLKTGKGVKIIHHLVNPFIV